jgi:hypothetical protein
MGTENARAQALSDYWLANSTPPGAYNGDGGTTYPDRAVASRSIFVRPDCFTTAVPIVFAASRTWVQGESSDSGWCLTMLRYHYETGAMAENPYRYPAEPSANNYFVPTAMTVVQHNCEGGGEASNADTWIIVTGYSRSVAYGNTDFHTVCFNGAMTVRWAHTYSRPGIILTAQGIVGEYPVGIDFAHGNNYTVDPSAETVVVGITGNTWNGSNWDIQTIFYDVLNNGQILGVLTESTSADDLATGIRMFGDSTGDYPNPVSYVVGVRGTGSGNAMTAFRYSAHLTSAGSWVRTEKSFTLGGADLRANAMNGDYEYGTAGDVAFGAGRIARIDQTHMLLVKFDFYGDTQNHTYGENGYYTSFSYEADPEAPRLGEALCMDYRRMTGVGTLIALGGYSYRDSSHGHDSCIALFSESSGQPVLRWSAWTKPGSSNAFNVQDACTALRIAPDQNGVSTLNDFYIHATSQVPTSSTDMNLRAIVYTSSVSGDPEDPSSKASSGDPVDVSGTNSGGDIPRHLELIVESMQALDPWAHNFIVVGDVWNGSTAGFDVLTRRFRFVEPE